jgi:hypothetical protein
MNRSVSGAPGKMPAMDTTAICGAWNVIEGHIMEKKKDFKVHV